VRVEAAPTHNHQSLCLSCDGPLRNREGKFALRALFLRGIFKGTVNSKLDAPDRERADPGLRLT
jgi:hypothetical protein